MLRMVGIVRSVGCVWLEVEVEIAMLRKAMNEANRNHVDGGLSLAEIV